MGSRYLTDLAAVCRRTGAVVHEEPGWQTRARGSGGYSSGLPSHIMCHHTASGTGSDGQGDVTYMCHGAADAPIANLYLSRAGEIWVMAAGASNTNGSGSSSWPGGPTDDSMNAAAIGIEAANAGTGETWNGRQQDVYLMLVEELCAAYSITVDHVRDHEEWAGDRKCDVTGPARWAPAGNRAGCSGAPKWDMNAFRADVGGSNLPPPTIPDEEDDMPNPYILLNDIPNDPERGGCIIVEAAGLRTCGGAEQAYFKLKKWDFYIITSKTEWTMLMNSRRG